MHDLFAFVLLFALAGFALHAVPIPVSGRVVDANGQGVAAARVALIAVLPNGERMRLGASGKARPARRDGGLRCGWSLPPDGAGGGDVPPAGRDPGTVPVEALLTPLTQGASFPMPDDPGCRAAGAGDRSFRPAPPRSLGGAGQPGRGADRGLYRPPAPRPDGCRRDGGARPGVDEALSVAAWA